MPPGASAKELLWARELLDVGVGAELSEIERQHKKAALRTHPDKVGNEDSGPFLDVQKAYELLKDEFLRPATARTLLGSSSDAAKRPATPAKAPDEEDARAEAMRRRLEAYAAKAKDENFEAQKKALNEQLRKKWGVAAAVPSAPAVPRARAEIIEAQRRRLAAVTPAAQFAPLAPAAPASPQNRSQSSQVRRTQPPNQDGDQAAGVTSRTPDLAAWATRMRGLLREERWKKLLAMKPQAASMALRFLLEQPPRNLSAGAAPPKQGETFSIPSFAIKLQRLGPPERRKVVDTLEPKTINFLLLHLLSWR